MWRLLRSRDHFVTLREELESIDEYLDIEVVRFGPQLRVVKQIHPETLDVRVIERRGVSSPQSPPSRPQGPDDDPDFLRGLGDDKR